MRVTLQLTPAAAERVRAPRTRAAGDRVLPWLTQSLLPVHPTTRDATLVTFFTVEVNRPRDAAKLVARLLEDPSVEAAYIKPDDEPA